jgi:hypothetical protein
MLQNIQSLFKSSRSVSTYYDGKMGPAALENLTLGPEKPMERPSNC